jgi:hypothetical protein
MDHHPVENSRHDYRIYTSEEPFIGKYCTGNDKHLEASLKRIAQILCDFVYPDATHCPHS